MVLSIPTRDGEFSHKCIASAFLLRLTVEELVCMLGGNKRIVRHEVMIYYTHIEITEEETFTK